MGLFIGHEDLAVVGFSQIKPVLVGLDPVADRGTDGIGMQELEGVFADGVEVCGADPAGGGHVVGEGDAADEDADFDIDGVGQEFGDHVLFPDLVRILAFDDADIAVDGGLDPEAV